jgi:aconitate decarboxylase
LEVTAGDGTAVATRCEAPIGSWKRPVEASRVVLKASELLGVTIGAERAGELLQTLNEEASGLEVRKLLDLLVPLDIARTSR